MSYSLEDEQRESIEFQQKHGRYVKYVNPIPYPNWMKPKEE